MQVTSGGQATLVHINCASLQNSIAYLHTLLRGLLYIRKQCVCHSCLHCNAAVERTGHDGIAHKLLTPQCTSVHHLKAPVLQAATNSSWSVTLAKRDAALTGGLAVCSLEDESSIILAKTYGVLHAQQLEWQWEWADSHTISDNPP